MKRFLLACGCLMMLSAVGTAQGVATKGQAAPDFTATGIDGKDFKLSEITASGKNAVLIFDRANW